MTLGKFVTELLDDARAMRANGVPEDDIRSGLSRSLIAYAHEHGMVVAERDVPFWWLPKCGDCGDKGWVPAVRLVRGEPVEAVRRCACKAQPSEAPDYRARAAEKVAGGWK